MNSERHFSLLQLNQLVRDAINSRLYDMYWLETEISQINENRGHCYLEFIQNAGVTHGGLSSLILNIRQDRLLRRG